MENPNSILESVKAQIGILDDSYDVFDPSIVMAINSAFLMLNQLGVGPDDPFSITDNSTTWDEFIEGGSIELVKSYVGLRTRLLFDPPTNSALIEAINSQLQMFEFRLLVEAEKSKLYPADMSGIYIDEEDP